ncbi:vanW family protein [Clostridium sp. CAG:389]|nr:vanW family protein [Clostridium sp. CAG:389]
MKKKKLNWEELEKKATYNPIIEETEEEPIKKKRRKRKKINIKKIGENKTLLATIIFIIILVIMIFSVIFAILNINNNNILNGVKIEGIDVSGLSREEAKAKIETVYNAKKEEDIILKYNDFETTISQDILETNYDLDKAVNEAISLGKDGNIITNNYNILFALLGKKNIKVDMSINEEQIKDEIENIQTNIPGTIIEPDYYVENDKLIITPGQEGIKISVDNLINRIKNTLKTASSNQQYIEIPMDNVWPDKIDIEKIHDEIYKEVQDAYLTENPITIHPEVEGVDFDIEEAKKILENDSEQYEIPLKITKPNVTMEQIGAEAFPNKISFYSTRYDGGDVNRSTNLELACEKINDVIVLPGETFSYNKTLGERSKAAGYKTAKVYENGEVVDGIGGGICQISSTLYNAVLKANLEIVERRNHQFITSYVEEGRDATVAYGVTDFKFKNSRKYAIKIKASASNGVATIEIFGIKEEVEYQISFDTKTISTIPYTVKYIDDNTLKTGTEVVKQKGANGIVTETYLIKSLNGQVVSNTLLSKDTYSAMQRIVLRGTKK